LSHSSANRKQPNKKEGNVFFHIGFFRPT